MPDDELRGNLNAALLKSGFPFQRKVKQIIHAAPEWSVLYEEFPWRDDLNAKDSFLDIVAGTKQLLITVECKKAEDEKILFLVEPDGPVPECSCVSLGLQGNLSTPFPSAWIIRPESPNATFAIPFRNGKPDSNRLLEVDIQQLLRGTITAARSKQAQRTVQSLQAPLPILPLYVTTAELLVTEVDYDQLDLRTGKVTPNAQDFRSTPFVRFTKTFISYKDVEVPSLTAIVVQAHHIAELLSKFANRSPIEMPESRNRAFY